MTSAPMNITGLWNTVGLCKVCVSIQRDDGKKERRNRRVGRRARRSHERRREEGK